MPRHRPADQRARPSAFRPSPSGIPPVVLAFLESLRQLPLGAWSDAVRRTEELDARRPGSPERNAAGRARLRHLVESAPSLTARIRTRVHDTVAVLEGFVHPVDVLRMKKAALGAALALAARDDLDENDFARLYAPFAELIPLSETRDVPLPFIAGSPSRNGDHQ